MAPRERRTKNKEVTAGRGGAAQVSLENEGLRELPTWLVEAGGALRELDVTHNTLRGLPCLAPLAMLQVLYADRNRIAALPDSLFSLRSRSALRFLILMLRLF